MGRVGLAVLVLAVAGCHRVDPNNPQAAAATAKPTHLQFYQSGPPFHGILENSGRHGPAPSEEGGSARPPHYPVPFGSARHGLG